jgi:predicted esterase
VRGAAAGLLVLVLAGCGGAKHAAPAPQPRVEGPFGQGADQVWLVRPTGPTRSVVVFLHGLGSPIEDTPANHVPWLLHLAQRGSAVIYPRYESAPTIENQAKADEHALRGVALGLETLGLPKVPAVVIGYSRGGPLAVDLTAVAPTIGLDPRGVLAVFPARRFPTDPELDLRSLDPTDRIWVMIGDRDTVVGPYGADELLQRLAASGFPQRSVRLIEVVSHGGFSATHLSVLSNSASAHTAFWDTADALVTGVR